MPRGQHVAIAQLAKEPDEVDDEAFWGIRIPTEINDSWGYASMRDVAGLPTPDDFVASLMGEVRNG